MQRKLMRGRLLLFLALLLTIASGLALRRYGYAINLPFVVVKYGGSLLWGAMVYWLLATIFVSPRRFGIAAAALLIAVAVELFRLWHTPDLDAFRLTSAGALLLGRVFSLWNIVAYAAGIVLALVLDCTLSKPRSL
ncbi:ribosomal maturation YjgA family protein [Rhizobium sp. LEGMi135b]